MVEAPSGFSVFADANHDNDGWAVGISDPSEFSVVVSVVLSTVDAFVVSVAEFVLSTVDAFVVSVFFLFLLTKYHIVTPIRISILFYQENKIDYAIITITSPTIASNFFCLFFILY